ncbi:MAG: transposase [Weeksellaceae bacterium]
MKIEYHNLYIHYILITRQRFPFIQESSRIRIEKYITGIVANTESKLYSIYANPAHVHFLISRIPAISDQELITRIADGSLKFILDNHLCSSNFMWQKSAAAFSVSKSDVDKVCKYIINQPENHKRVSFKEEYDELIKFYLQTIKWEL